MRIDKKPREYNEALSRARNQWRSVEPQEGVPLIHEALRKAVPPAACIIDVLANKLEDVQAMWELGQLEEHYQDIHLTNCEPFGIEIAIRGHMTVYDLKTIVVPTAKLFLHMDDVLGDAIGKLTREMCRGKGCTQDESHYRWQ